MIQPFKDEARQRARLKTLDGELSGGWQDGRDGVSTLRGGVPKGIESQIFAIGGGELHTRETFEIDRLIATTSGRNRPWALCVTAAAGDTPAACDGFGYIYGDALRCRTDYLRLLKGEPGGDDFERKIARSEIIYFSDGDVKLLIDTLGKFRVAEALREAYARGVILCGVGAGAVCWGHEVLGEEGLEGLGLLDFGLGVSTCIENLDPVQDQVNRDGHTGLVLDRLAVLHVRGTDYRVISPDAHLGVRRFTPGGRADATEVLGAEVQFRPIEQLAAGARDLSGSR